MSTQPPRLSIGLPVYNGERYLQDCLESLLGQTFTDFELIISDNASTDDTPGVCQRYARRDPRIRYVRNGENIGVNRNFNRVFQLSRSDYFKWAAADDVCGPNLLTRCVQVLDNDPTVVLAYGKATFIDEAGNTLPLADPGWDLQSNAPLDRMRYVIHSGHWVNSNFGVIRAQVLASTRLFPLYSGGDYRLMAELSLRGKFIEIAEPLFYRRIHPAASGKDLGANGKTIYMTGKDRCPGLPLWQLCLDHLITIHRSRLTPSDKLSLAAQVIGRINSEKRQFIRELRTLYRYYNRPRKMQI